LESALLDLRDDEVNARERDAELLEALQANMRNALTEEERLVVDLRIQGHCRKGRA
jgi:hypothetical protein